MIEYMTNILDTITHAAYERKWGIMPTDSGHDCPAETVQPGRFLSRIKRWFQQAGNEAEFADEGLESRQALALEVPLNGQS